MPSWIPCARYPASSLKLQRRCDACHRYLTCLLLSCQQKHLGHCITLQRCTAACEVQHGSRLDLAVEIAREEGQVSRMNLGFYCLSHFTGQDVVGKPPVRRRHVYLDTRLKFQVLMFGRKDFSGGVSACSTHRKRMVDGCTKRICEEVY